MKRTTLSLNKDAYNFLLIAGGENKSAFVNSLLIEERQRHLKEAILKANKEEAEDKDYQKNLKEWEATLSDGI